VKSAPSAFQIIVSNILGEKEGVLCYLDDILIVAKVEKFSKRDSKEY